MPVSDNASGKWINDEIGIISPTSPLRLETAARLAFPDGSMTISGLRREIARGRLSYEMIAGKHYTTLADIEEMRKLCRVQARPKASQASCAREPGRHTACRLGRS